MAGMEEHGETERNIPGWMTKRGHDTSQGLPRQVLVGSGYRGGVPRAALCGCVLARCGCMGDTEQDERTTSLPASTGWLSLS